jgi:hypothetical protein
MRLAAPVLVERRIGVSLEPPVAVPIRLTVTGEEQRCHSG